MYKCMCDIVCVCVLCCVYIKGCCQHHPGVPVFHDALKGWSCCSRRSTDFTEFLNIPGCANGRHSSEKPPEPEKKPQAEVSCPEVTSIYCIKVSVVCLLLFGHKLDIKSSFVALVFVLGSHSSIKLPLILFSAVLPMSHTHCTNVLTNRYPFC